MQKNHWKRKVSADPQNLLLFANKFREESKVDGLTDFMCLKL